MNRAFVSILCLISAFTFAEETKAANPPETATLTVETETSETLPDLPEATTAQKVLEASEAMGVLMAKRDRKSVV